MIKIFKLVSRLIELNHPIILDIRWRFCEIVSSEMRGKKTRCWDEKEVWSEYVKKHCRYTLFEVVRSLLAHQSFMDSTIAALQHEVSRLRSGGYYWLAFEGSERYWSTWQENYERSAR